MSPVITTLICSNRCNLSMLKVKRLVVYVKNYNVFALNTSKRYAESLCPSWTDLVILRLFKRLGNFILFFKIHHELEYKTVPITWTRIQTGPFEFNLIFVLHKGNCNFMSCVTCINIQSTFRVYLKRVKHQPHLADFPIFVARFENVPE